MSDTPETDGQDIIYPSTNGGKFLEPWVSIDFARKLERERDEARTQYRTTELLGLELVKTIARLKAEKADLFVKLVNLQSGSRRATLDEIAESVRDKYDPRHEGDDDE